MQREPICETYRQAAEVVGRRWNLELIRALQGGPARYGELRTAVGGISDHLLSERLKALEAAGLVDRSVTPDTPVRIEYALSRKGADLSRALDELADWAERWAEVPA